MRDTGVSQGRADLPGVPSPRRPMTPPLARTLDTATDFVLSVLDAAGRDGRLSWVDINRLAAAHLRPGADGDSSRRGHAVVVEMAGHGLLDAELTTAADGGVMVREAVRPAVAVPYALAA